MQRKPNEGQDEGHASGKSPKGSNQNFGHSNSQNNQRHIRRKAEAYANRSQSGMDASGKSPKPSKENFGHSNSQNNQRHIRRKAQRYAQKSQSEGFRSRGRNF